MNQDEALIALCKALLQDPDVTSLTPGQRNNTLRTRARDLLH